MNPENTSSFFCRFAKDKAEVGEILRFAVYIPESAAESPEFIEVIGGHESPDKFARMNLLRVALVMAEEGDFISVEPSQGVVFDIGSESRKIDSGVVAVKSDSSIAVLAISGNTLDLVRIAHKYFTRQVRLDVK
jgi:hypothetical protein